MKIMYHSSYYHNSLGATQLLGNMIYRYDINAGSKKDQN